MLLVCRFTPDDTAAFLERARRAVALLSAQPGCRGVELGRATEDAGRWVLVASFTSISAYRRALGPFDVREHVVPFLAEALTDEPASFERQISADPDGVVDHASVLTDRRPGGGPDRGGKAAGTG